MNDYILAHHGIKGQKWGVRRFQNEDGSLTPDGRERVRYRNNVIRNVQFTNDVNEIVDTLPYDEKIKLGASNILPWIPESRKYSYASTKLKTFITKINDVPVSMLEIYEKGKSGEIAIATRSGEQYRNKGLAGKEVEKAIKYVDRYANKRLDELVWYAFEDNKPSRNLAEKYGFKLDENYKDDNFVKYTRKVSKSK